MLILSQKKCTKCGEWKDKTEYSKKKGTKDGLRTYCKKCGSKDTRAWYSKNTQRAISSKLKYYLDNVEKIRKDMRARYQKNKEEANRQSREWYSNNSSKAKADVKRWKQKHPDKVYEGVCNRRALKKGSLGKFTAKEWQALKEFYGFTCLRCGQREPNISLTPDHIKPLVMGGANTIDNIQPLCNSCNSSKNAKWIDYR